MAMFTIYDPATGKIHMPVEAPDLATVVANCPEHMSITEGWFEEASHFIDGAGQGQPRPIIPGPSEPDLDLVVRWLSPPPGFRAVVYDLWTVPPTLLIDTDLALPDCGLRFTYGGAQFRVDLTANYPWLPSSWEVTT